MACPHAKTIKGAVAYCNIVKKKVSTLKFPCKGDYRRCPIYVRARPQQVEATKEAKPEERVEVKEEKAPPPQPSKPAEPAPVRAVKPPEPPVEEPKPVEAPAREEPAKAEEPKPAVQKPTRIVWQPGGALCDSMVIALLLVSSKSVGTYKGGYDGLEDMLKKLETNGIFYYIAGDADRWRVRFTYANMKVFGLSVEKDGKLICGDEALKLIEPVEEKKFDVVIYSVSWDDLGPAAEKLRKSL